MSDDTSATATSEAAPETAPSPPTVTEPDPVVTVPRSLEDLARDVEAAQTAHMAATEAARVSADKVLVTHMDLHIAITKLIDAAKADEPA